MADKWVEVNIHLDDYARTNEVIKETVGKFVQDFKNKSWIKSWHFFREPEIRLRFFGEEEDIKEARKTIDDELNKLEASRGDVYSCHVFGNHGRRDEEYVGEAGYWLNDWLLVMKLWERTSEFSLDLISKGPNKSLEIHGERHVHLLLNQLGLPHAYIDTGTERIIKYRRTKLPNE